MTNENFVDFSEFVEIGHNDIILVPSKDCGETMILFQNPKSPCGIKGIVATTSNVNKVKTACTKVGLNGTFKYAPLNDYGEAYICKAGQKEGVAICVKEIVEDGEKHLKLCKVIIRTNKAQSEIELDKSEELENELYMQY